MEKAFPTYSSVEIEARCKTCQMFWNGLDADRLGSIHAKKFHHTVLVYRITSLRYDYENKDKMKLYPFRKR